MPVFFRVAEQVVFPGLCMGCPALTLNKALKTQTPLDVRQHKSYLTAMLRRKQKQAY